MEPRSPSFLHALLEQQGAPSLAVAVVHQGRRVVAQGQGWANLEWRVPATSETVYQIGSVTKPFTALAVLMLVQEGRLALDAPLGSFLPLAPKPWHAVTLRQLLSHTGGVPSEIVPTGKEHVFVEGFPPEKLLTLLTPAPLEFEPGTRWSYSNLGYYLLGLVIERGAGRSYARFLQERVFQPLGMTQTRVNDRTALVPQRASGYEEEKGTFRNVPSVPGVVPYAAGAILSTVQDLAKSECALLQGRLLSPALFKEMVSPVTLKDGTRTDYGLGWTVDRVGGRQRIYHPGGIPGFSSVVLRYPGEKLSVIVLCNHMRALGGLAATIAEHYLSPLPGSVRVSLVLRNRPELKKATVAGEFNGWSQSPLQRKGRDWQITLQIPPGHYRYKFVTDGTWITDPDNKTTTTDSEGNTNSVLIVPEKKGQ